MGQDARDLPWLEEAIRGDLAAIGHKMGPLPSIDYTRAGSEMGPPDAKVALHGGVHLCRIVSVRIVVAVDESGTGQ